MRKFTLSNPSLDKAVFSSKGEHILSFKQFSAKPVVRPSMFAFTNKFMNNTPTNKVAKNIAANKQSVFNNPLMDTMKNDTPTPIFVRKGLTRLAAFATLLLISVQVAFGQVPTITSFSPSYGAAGSTVTITGTNFDAAGGNNIVFFGTTKAIITSETSTQLVVTVPTGARSGSLTVINTNTKLLAHSSKSFVYSFTNSSPTNVTSSNFDSPILISNLSSASWSGAKQNGCFGDIDGDGKTDLIKILNSTSAIRVLKNASVPGSLTAANFSVSSDYTTLSDPREIEIGDLNNDGKLDLVVTYDNTNISIFINNSTSGNISFLSKQDFTVASSRLVRIHDVNFDGKNDIILSSKGGSSVNIYSNSTSLPSNTITLSAVSTLTGASSINHIFIKDINNDNLPDINLSSGSNFFSFINSNSTSGVVSFNQNISIAAPTTVHSNIVEDFNNDNIKDVALGYTWTTDGGVIQNNYSSGTISASNFSSVSTIPLLTSSSSNWSYHLDVSDFNGDNKLDLINSDFNAGNTVKIITNNNTTGSGTTISGNNFSAQYIGNGSSYGTAWGVDLDNDGKCDWVNFSSDRITIGRNKTAEAPTITTTGTGSISSFSSCVNSPSISQTFTVSGTRLTAPISLTSNQSLFEFSVNGGSTYSNAPITFTPSNGTVALTTVYMRVKSNATATSFTNAGVSLNSTGANGVSFSSISGTISSLPTITGSSIVYVGGSTSTLTGSGTPDATSPWTSSDPSIATVDNSGVVSAVAAGNFTITYLANTGCSKSKSMTSVSAVVNASTTSLSNFTACANNPSVAQSFTVDGTNLSSSVTVIAPAGFEVSLSQNSGFGSSVTIAPSGNALSATTVYARMAANATSPANGSIEVASTDATSVFVSVTGTVAPAPAITAVSLTLNERPCGATATGSANVAVTGGQPQYTYSWTRNGVAYAASPADAPTHLLSGTYIVTVSDNCVNSLASNSLAISNGSVMTITSTSTVNNTCYGGTSGSITTVISGGTAPRTITATNTSVTPNVSYSVAVPTTGTTYIINNLPAGNYTVSANDISSCTPSASNVIIKNGCNM